MKRATVRYGNRMPFAVDAFYRSVDRVRTERGLLWKDVAEQTQLSQSTFVRLGHGKQPDINTFSVIVDWAELDPASFFTGPDGDGSTLVQMITLIHADTSLSAPTREAIDKIVSLVWTTLAE